MLDVVGGEHGAPVSEGAESAHEFVVEAVLRDRVAPVQGLEGRVDALPQEVLEGLQVQRET